MRSGCEHQLKTAWVGGLGEEGARRVGWWLVWVRRAGSQGLGPKTRCRSPGGLGHQDRVWRLGSEG